MRKTIQDVASHLKEILVPGTHEAYAVHPIYTTITTEESIREGVLAFRAFLVRLYDDLYATGTLYDTSKKVAHEYENRTTLSVYYPFLHNVSTLLINIGYRGIPIEREQALACGNTIFSSKLSVSKEETDVLSIVQDTIAPLAPDVQEFILHLHKRYLDKGLSCIVEVKGFHIYIKYCYKRKDLWGINASLNNGDHINVKSVKTQEYTDIIKTFSPSLQELIAKGYGCGRKREIGHCDGGCRGIPIVLDDSVLEIKNQIETWLDQEVS